MIRLGTEITSAVANLFLLPKGPIVALYDAEQFMETLKIIRSHEA